MNLSSFPTDDMTNAHDAAFARPFSEDPRAGGVLEQSGLTKREHFAAMMAQGILANPDCGGDGPCVVRAAVLVADALIAALNATPATGEAV